MLTLQRIRPAIATSFIGFTFNFSRVLCFSTGHLRPYSHLATVQLPYSTRSFATMNISNQEFDEVFPFEAHAHGSAIIRIPEKDKQLSNPNPNPINTPDPFQEANFRERLSATILACKTLNKSTLWIQVPMNRSRLIEYMSDSGFQYHHAEGRIANLYLWLNGKIECKIPSYGTHQVGVGAVVVNSKNEILCVREIRNNYLKWKIPGGLSELGEHLDEAATREVLEETGIPTQFISVLAVRHTHGLQFNRSDLYFVCKLRPIETKDKKTSQVCIPEPVPQEGEIEATSWVPMAEYLDMIEKEHPTMKHIMKLYDQSAEIEMTLHESVVPGRLPSPIYHASLPK